MTKGRYDLYVNIQGMGIVQAADCVVVEEKGVLSDFGLRYREAFLAQPGAFSLDPAQLPLGEGPFELSCRGGMPGLIDDYLPDAWGRRVLAHLAFYRDRKEYNAHSVIDALSMIGHSRIGALCIVEQGASPFFDPGVDIACLEKAEAAAQQVDATDFREVSVDEMSLLYLANNGTGVGGARPKALVCEAGRNYIAKFNRLSQDPFNNARIELACLVMANSAGIDTPAAKVRTGINGREVLLVERFDVNEDGTRNHLVSINALLKEPHSQRDVGRAFRYDDIRSVLQQRSGRIEPDLQQLLKRMLFNRMINNTDDHERNFSLLYDGECFAFAPAYDMIPSVERGAYHAAGFQFSPLPPRPTEVARLGKVFGLPKAVVARCAEVVRAAGAQWHDIAQECGVEEREADRVQSLFHL
ncbi:MAG: type II toxin-antitoxin system HipA family toxin [Candidatus Sedimenticola sp. PURPLELP]